MRMPSLWGWSKIVVAIAILLLSGVRAAAQSTADQTVKNLPQQVKDNAENRASTKTNNLSGEAINKLDSASNKAFRGFTGLFKKKNKAAADSTKLHKTDTIPVPGKPTSYNLKTAKNYLS
jgi:hypothetical protein